MDTRDLVPQDAITRAIADLRALPLADLRFAWRRTFRRKPAPGLTRGLLLSMLAYQLQADRHGDLSPASQAVLERIAAKIANRRVRPGKGPLVPPLPMNSFQVGTVFVRSWNGRREAVTVVEGGFLWQGTIYATLSAVARAITGTNWNGWRFFGLREADKPARPSVCSTAKGRRRTGADAQVPA